MTTAELHEMTLEQTFASGAQQWHCPVCQRRTVMHYLPQQGRLKTIELETGDGHATHATGTAGLRAGAVQAGETHSDTRPQDSGLLH